MKFELQYFCKVSDDGSLQGLPRQKFASEIRQFFKGQSVEIIVRRKRKHRSVQQNRYYWLIVTMMADYTGFTKDEMHSVLKSRFLKSEKVNTETGAVFEYVKSSAGLSTVEAEEYYDQVRQFASEEFGINIPLPNEQIAIL